MGSITTGASRCPLGRRSTRTSARHLSFSGDRVQQRRRMEQRRSGDAVHDRAGVVADGMVPAAAVAARAPPRPGPPTACGCGSSRGNSTSASRSVWPSGRASPSDLHDTLLQGFISASMQLHVAAGRLPDGSPARVVVRPRERSHAARHRGGTQRRARPRSSGVGPRISSAPSRACTSELGTEGAVDFQVTVEGANRAVSSLIRDEVYRIGREAVVNAVRHAGARKIAVEVEYSSAALRIVVRDDGCGIDPEVLPPAAPDTGGSPACASAPPASARSARW